MVIRGIDFITPLLTKPYFTAKMVFNAHGAIIFPVNQEHRDQTAQGISYEDNYIGNALAAMLAPDKIEIRFHQDFTDNEVARIITVLKDIPELMFMSDWETTYQGRPLDT